MKFKGKFYDNQTVFETSLERIRKLYDSFENVVVCVSGGKDSTVLLNMTKIVAIEKNRLPINVMFIDQEAEWCYTEDEIRKIMYADWVTPYWLQVPFTLPNSASSNSENQYLNVWAENEKHLRERDPIAITSLPYKLAAERTNEFYTIFEAFALTYFKGKDCCMLGGVRADESPSRYISLTRKARPYKGMTFFKEYKEKNHYVFYPIYDWGTSDIWKAIFDNKWSYNELYNKQFQAGVSWQRMRVSALIHENALEALFYVQEFDPRLYNAMVEKLEGINAIGKIGKMNWFPETLPFMFSSWKEYSNYLLDNLITDEFNNAKMRKAFESAERKLTLKDEDWKNAVSSIVSGDFTLTKWQQFILRNKYVEGDTEHKESNFRVNQGNRK